MTTHRETFTKGPWNTKRAEVRTDGAYDFAIYDSATQVIAEVFGRTSITNYQATEANARLIAAAPDLYEALKELRINANRLVDRSLGSYEDCRMSISVADVALAKAIGQPVSQ